LHKQWKETTGFIPQINLWVFALRFYKTESGLEGLAVIFNLWSDGRFFIKPSEDKEKELYNSINSLYNEFEEWKNSLSIEIKQNFPRIIEELSNNPNYQLVDFSLQDDEEPEYKKNLNAMSVKDEEDREEIANNLVGLIFFNHFLPELTPEEKKEQEDENKFSGNYFIFPENADINFGSFEEVINSGKPFITIKKSNNSYSIADEDFVVYYNSKEKSDFSVFLEKYMQNNLF